MPAISGPQAGPVAVTGASGYIGSHLVKNLIEHGYAVRACLRDISRDDKTSYLKAIAAQGPGSLTLHACDLHQAGEGAYDAVFAGCTAVFHVAADLGTDATYGKPSPQAQYDSLLSQTIGVYESCRRAGTVKRIIYTSSAAAVMGPRDADTPQDSPYTENDWAGGTFESLEARHTYVNKQGETVEAWSIERSAYAKGKVDAERYGYTFGAESGIDVVSICPCHVLGPLLGTPHDSVWQHRIGLFLSGKSDFPERGMDWNIVDVRDIAEAQRLAAENEIAGNGSRYLLVANDEAGEPQMQELLDMLAELFPDRDIAGDYAPRPSSTRLRARCTKAVSELGLKPHDVRDTLRDTGRSLIALGCISSP